MKQSTFSAQVANNLLTLLQGYSKTIRLLLVMFVTLTVTTNAWGETLTLNNLGASLTSTSNSTISTTTITATGDNKSSYIINYLQCKKQTNGSSHAMLLAKSVGAFISNKTAMPGNIKSVTVYVLTGAAGKTTYHCAFSKTECTSAYTTGSTAVNITGGNSNKYTCTVSNAKYFCISLGNTNNGQVYKLDVEYEVDTPPSCTTNPTVSMGSHSNVTTTTATVSCTNGITSLGSAGCSIESYGFVYGTSTNPTISNTKVQVGTTYTTTSTAFTKELTGLTANTTYYVRPYATNGNGTAYGTQTSFKTLELPKYTVTLVPGSGTCAASVTETSAGAGVTLPTPTLDCGDWEFAGWATSAVATETSSKPATLLTGTYKPASNITLYAVYQRTEETEGNGGTENVSRSYTFSQYTAGAQYAEGEEHELDDVLTLTTTQCHFTTELRIYSSDTHNGYVVSNQLPGRIVSIGFNAGNKVDAIDVFGSTNGTDWTEVEQVGVTSTSYKDYTLDFGETNYTYFKLDVVGSNQVRLKSITITWESTSAGGTITTTYYHSTPDCGSTEPSQLATPTGLNVTNITSTSATLSWGEVANASSYTVFITDLDDEEITLIDIEEASVDVTGLSPETLYLWEVVAIGDGANYTDSEHSSQEDPNAEFTTRAAASPATITLSELGVTKTISTYSVGDQYTLPTTSSQSCDGKELVGWSTVEVAETNTKPTSNYYELGAEVTLAVTQTFYAVFAAGSGGGGGAYTKVTTISDGTYLIAASKDENTSYAYTGVVTGKTYGGYTDVTITDDKITTKPNDALEITVKVSDNNFSMYDGTNYLCLTSDGNNLNFNNSIEKIEWTLSDGKIQNTYITSSTRYLQFNASSGSERFACYKNTQKDAYLYKKTGGGYTAYSTSCIPTYSITYDFAGGTGSHCSNTSVPQGDTYTICDNAPTKEGHTFLHWSDGTSTYAAGATITPTGDVTLTAVWKANTYTVTWNSNGATTSKTYNHGDELVVPTAPASCDGVKEFVGWTTHSGYYHATTAPDDIFTTKTTPVTATATYYAVFATPGAGGTEFVLGESGTFKMYANVDGTNHYAQGGVSSNKLSSTTDILTASDYTLTYADGSYTIKQGTSTIGHSSSTNLTSTTASTWTISAGANGSWRITSDEDNSRALSYSAEANAFKAYATSNLTAGNETYFDIEFGSGSDAHSDYTTICQTVESIEIANYTTEFFVTDEFAFGGTVTAHFDGGGTQDVTALAHFSGYNMNVTGTYTITVTYMGATATYEINVKPLNNAWVLTWNVSGKTNTGLGPRSVTKGSAIVTLPTPEVPAACAGKTFMGWTTSNVVNSDGSGITYITKETVPTANTTYYAVFATVNNFSVQKPITDIKSGSKVVIVAVASLDNTGSTGKAISSRTISTTSKGVIGLAGDDVAIFDETINTPHNTCIWTLTKQGETVAFEQGSKYIRATDAGYRRLVLDATADYWTLITVAGKDKTYHMKSGNTSHYVEWFDHTDSKYDEGERYIGFIPYTEANNNGDFDMQFFVVAGDGEADITDYTTGCAEYTITYYGFQGGYSTSCSSDGTIVLPVNSLHTIPNCGDVVKDHTNLNRTFTGVWMTKPHGGQTFKPGDTFILTQDTTLYAQWELNTQNDFTTLPTDVEDLAGTDIYVYGGKTLTLQPGTTTINSLTLKGGIQTDGSYQMPSIWVPEGATLVRNSNKIYLDLVVNAKTWYPFAVPFETKNTSDIHYLHPDMKSAAKYSKHFDIKTYDGARRADVGEDKANNWVRLKRHTAEEPVSFKPGVGYIISAMAYPGTDTATIRIPMTVPNTWFKNGEQAVVGTTVRNTIAVTAHTGEAATEHQRHAGWNFVANPYLSNFTGGGIDASNGLDYIDGELIIQGSYEYSEETVPYVTIPAYNFAYYSQHKLSEVKLSPEWSFFVQVGTSGTMDFTTTGRQQAPASIAARAEERPVKMDVDITLSDNHSSDQTGIIISDRYNDTYEIGRDLEKLFGSAYNLSVYTLMADNTPLAFQALAIRSSMQVIPVGYRAPEQGEYTFRLNEATSSIDLLNEQYEQLVLVDYQTGELTNLLISDYTFYSERTQADNRFAIYAVPRQNAPTDLPNAIGQDKQAQKIIHNGHLYILRDGNVYNGNGQIVK